MVDAGYLFLSGVRHLQMFPNDNHEPRIHLNSTLGPSIRVNVSCNGCHPFDSLPPAFTCPAGWGSPCYTGGIPQLANHVLSWPNIQVDLVPRLAKNMGESKAEFTRPQMNATYESLVYGLTNVVMATFWGKQLPKGPEWRKWGVRPSPFWLPQV